MLLRRILSVGALWLTSLALMATVAAGSWLVAQHALHLRLLSVQTGSMRPLFGPGDAVIMRTLGAGQVHPGMVVAYHSPRNPGELITHRIIRVWGGGAKLQTKGDALTVADPPVRRSLLAGQVVLVLPSLGGVLDRLRSWPGLVATVYVPAGSITAYELYRLERRAFRGPTYRLNQRPSARTSGMMVA